MADTIRRGNASRSRQRNEWVPPSWDDEPPQKPAQPERPATPDPAGRERIAHVAALGVPYAITAMLAALFSLVPTLGGNGSVPRGLIVLLLIQLLGFTIGRANEWPALSFGWMSCLLASGVFLPLLSLQVTLLREPYVSLERHSAGPAMFATLVVATALLIVAAWSLNAAWRVPDEAAMLFMPQAMLIPMMIGMRLTVQQDPALQALAEVMLLSGIACLVVLIVPRQWRPFVPAGALAVEFVLLWALNRGPWFHVTSGGIVRVLYSLLLVLAVVLVVAVPFISMWMRGQNPGWHAPRQRYVRRQQAAPPPARRPATPANRPERGLPPPRSRYR